MRDRRWQERDGVMVVITAGTLYGSGNSKSRKERRIKSKECKRSLFVSFL